MRQKARSDPVSVRTSLLPLCLGIVFIVSLLSLSAHRFPCLPVQSPIKPPPALPHPHVVPESQGNLIPAVRVNKDYSLFSGIGHRTPGQLTQDVTLLAAISPGCGLN